HGTDLPGTEVRAEGQEATADATVNRAYAGLGAATAGFPDRARCSSRCGGTIVQKTGWWA
ncbi:hypothetical protein EAO71_13500, partial [Streptomyces sp. ms191]